MHRTALLALAALSLGAALSAALAFAFVPARPVNWLRPVLLTVGLTGIAVLLLVAMVQRSRNRLGAGRRK